MATTFLQGGCFWLRLLHAVYHTTLHHQVAAMAAGAQARGRAAVQELQFIIRLATPSIVQCAAQQAMVFTDRIFLGHLGTNEMAAAALGDVYSSIPIFFLIGAASALDTLGATAHGAARSKVPIASSLATWTATAMIVLSALCMVSMACMAAAGPFTQNILRQDEEISKLVEKFVLCLMPGLAPMAWGTILTKYLQVQGVVVSPAIVTIFTFGLNIAANVVLIKAFGFIGGPLATSFSQLVQCLSLAGMVLLFVISRPGRAARRQQRLQLSQPCTEQNKSRKELASAVGWACIDWMFYGAEDIDTLEPLEPVKSSGIDCIDYSLASKDMPAQDPSAQGTTPTTLHRNSSSSSSSSTLTPEDAKVLHELQQVYVETEAISISPRTLPSTDIQPPGASIASKLRNSFRKGATISRAWTFLKLALPGGFLLCAEYLAFDVNVAMAAQLGPDVTAAHSVLDSLISLASMSLPYAVGVAGSIRVGNLLGEGAHHRAHLAAWLSVGLGTAFMLCCAAAAFAARSHVGYIFTNDEGVVDLVASTLPMLALLMVADGAWVTAEGVLRSCGRQTQLMVLSTCGFWGGGVLLGALLCFKAKLDLQGLWWGLAAGSLITMLGSLVILLRVNWQDESRIAQQRLQDATPQCTAAIDPQGTESIGSSVVLSVEMCGDTGGTCTSCETESRPNSSSPSSSSSGSGSSRTSPAHSIGALGMKSSSTSMEFGTAECQHPKQMVYPQATNAVACSHKHLEIEADDDSIFLPMPQADMFLALPAE